MNKPVAGIRKYLCNICLLLICAPALRGQELRDSVSGQYRIEQVVIDGRPSCTVVGGITDGTLRLDMSQSDAMPRFAGVADPLRFLHLMSGVQAPADGDSGFYVRGGDAGQSAVLLNNAPLYSYAHLLGFFSTFNPGHVSTFELDKSGTGAATGNAPGPTLRAQPRENVPLDTELSGEMGLIATQATLSVPLDRNRKVALHLSARRSYAEWLISLLAAKEVDNLEYTLQDYDATLVWEISPRHKLLVNGHYGDDRMQMRLDDYLVGGRIRWHNSASSAQLRSELSEWLSLEQTLYVSDFGSQLRMGTVGVTFSAPSSLVDAGYKGALTWQREHIRLRAGINYAYRTIRPQHIATNYDFITADRTLPASCYRTHELAPYISVRGTLARQLAVELSLRYAVYTMQRRGAAGSGDRYTTSAAEPAAALEYRLSPRHLLKAAYTYGHQYTGLVPVSSTSFSTDFWTAATQQNPPMRSHNLSLGYYTSLLDGRIRLSAEAYYRRMYNALEYDMPLMNMLHAAVDVESRIYSGDGEAYGVEWMAAYSSKRLNGWVSYTLGSSVRQFVQLNDGHPFPAKLDRRHTLSAALSWSPTSRWDISAIFVYASSAAYTAPTEFYFAGGSFVRGHSSYNGSRLPAYHRLDLSVTRWFGQKNVYRHGLNFSLYDCYNRKNPLYISWPIYYPQDEEVKQLTSSRRKHYLHKILPSLSWIFRF